MLTQLTARALGVIFLKSYEETAMAEAKKEKDEVVFIRTVFGDMVDPTNNQRYTTEGQKAVMTPWIKIQAEAGKIVFE